MPGLKVTLDGNFKPNTGSVAGRNIKLLRNRVQHLCNAFEDIPPSPGGRFDNYIGDYRLILVGGVVLFIEKVFWLRL